MYRSNMAVIAGAHRFMSARGKQLRSTHEPTRATGQSGLLGPAKIRFAAPTNLCLRQWAVQ